MQEPAELDGGFNSGGCSDCGTASFKGQLRNKYPDSKTLRQTLQGAVTKSATWCDLEG